MVNRVKIFAVLMAVVQTSASDLGKLAGTIEALRGKWVDWIVINAPVGAC